jgi:hypothetical protein
MKQAKTKKRISRREKELSVLHVREYIDRYHPEMKGSEVDISPCGTFASVRKAQKKDQR